MGEEKTLKFKINQFRLAFPLADQDSELDIDSKHKRILKESSKTLDWMGSLTYKNLRNWHMQSDMDAPPSLRAIVNGGIQGLPSASESILMGIFRRRQVAELRGSMEDDLSVIKLSGAYDLLKANPVHVTPGKTPYVMKDGASYNNRWLRYIYLAGQIRKFELLQTDSIWVDIGSYYGGLQSIIKKWNKETAIVLVDFHHQLLRSYVFLSEMFPDSIHNLGVSGDIGKIRPGTFSYIPVTEFSQLNEMRTTLVTNFFSFGEMKRKDFTSYIDSPLFQRSHKIYSVNRVVSAPFFEPTYDSDLTVWDYNFENFNMIYFDLFPIHHYQAINRELYGKTRYRNASSPYFELIQLQNKS